jgi:U3 small nucleolar ribonucleoprotein component
MSNIFPMENNFQFTGALREFDEQSMRDEEDSRDIQEEQDAERRRIDDAYDLADEWL